MSERPAMRRAERALTEADAIGIIRESRVGVLCTAGEGGAYGVPMHHVYKDGHIYMHCAPEGHKLVNIARDDRVCYTVIEDGWALNAPKLTTRYRSAMAFGRACVLEGEAAREPLLELCRVLAPAMTEEVARTFSPSMPMRVIDILVQSVSGKGAPGE